MPHMNDILVDRLARSWTEIVSGTANTAATVTHAGVTGAKHVVTRIDATYDVATTTNASLLEIRFGSTVVWRSYVHGLNNTPNRVFADMELMNSTTGQAIDAVMSTTVAGVKAIMTLHGYTVDDMT
jgi:hypothetical protein